MRQTAAARRYARALFGLARDENAVEETRRELDQLHALLGESPELHDALFRPLFPVAQRRAVIRDVAKRLGSSQTLQNFYGFLVDQRRIIDFDAIREEYGRLADRAAGRTRAEVVSASPLSDAQRTRLEAALASRTGQQVELDVRVDPALLGGAVASVGDLVFDGSLRTQLSTLRASLTKEQ